MFADHSKVMRV